MNAWRRLIVFLAALAVPLAGTVLLATSAHAATVTYSNPRVTSYIGSYTEYEAYDEVLHSMTWSFTTTPSSTSTSVQWYRKSGTTVTAIAGADSPSLVMEIPAAWVGNTVFQRWTINATGYTSATYDTPGIPVVKGKAGWGDVWRNFDPVTYEDTGYELDPSNVHCATVKANGVAITPGTAYLSRKHITFTAVLSDPTNCVWGDPADGTRTQVMDLRIPVDAPNPPTNNTTAMTVTLPAVSGLAYRINGVIKPAGTHVSRGNNTITAEGADDTHRAGDWFDPSTGWHYDGSPTWVRNNPITTVTPQAPTSNPTTGVIAVPNTTGVYYKLDGQIVQGNNQTWKNATVTAVPADARYDLTGTTSWTFDHRRPVTPAAPTFAQATLSYTIPTTTGVTYQVGGTAKAAGTYPGSGTVAITAVAADDTYKLATGATTSWSFNATAQSVTAVAPTLNQAGTSYIIPSSIGVRYMVAGVEKAAGTYPATTQITVTAEAASVGYTLTGTSTWTFDLRTALTPALVTSDGVNFTYTVPTSAGVEYVVAGAVKPAGTYDATAGSVAVTARPVDSTTTRIATGAVSSWTLTFATENVTPTAPSMNQATHQLTVPATVGVRYLVDDEVKAAGTYTYHRQVAVAAESSAKKYVLVGTKAWTFDLRDPVTPAAVTQDGVNFTYTIPTSAGVEYLVAGAVKPAGTHDATGSSVIVTARPVDAVTNRIAAGATASWTLTFATEEVTPTAPTMNQGTSQLTIPASTGVRYQVDGAVKAAGTYTYHRQVAVSAESSAKKYVLVGTKAWTFDLRDPVTPAAVTQDDVNFTYTIPTASGVEYVVGGAVKPAGTHDATVGSVTVTARPMDTVTQRIAAGATASWTFTFATEDVTPAAPSMNQATNELTVPATNGVRYLVDGEVRTAGTYTYHREVAVTAEAAAKKYALTGTKAWTFDLRDPVTPAAPTADDVAFTYSIPHTPGVEYLVAGAVKPAGTYDATAGSVTVTARPADATHRIAVGATASWTLTFATEDVTAPAPTVDQHELTIPARAGVRYLVDGAVKAAGTHPYHRQVEVSAEATAKKYVVVGTAAWSFDLRDVVTPAAPVWDASAWSVTVPSTPGVSYRIDGVAKAAGSYPAASDTVVTAVALDASITRLAPGATDSWSSPLQATSVTAKAPTSDRAKGTLTIPAVTGVTYLVEGKVTGAGTIKVTKKVVVTARAASVKFRLTGAASWTLDLTPVLRTARAAKPTLVKASGRLVLKKITGVVWKVNGKTVTTTKKIIVKKGGKVRVLAVAAPGYKLAGTTSWVIKRAKR